MDKPRICEVLGVEVGEEFTYDFGENQVRGTFKIGADGKRYYKDEIDTWYPCYSEEGLSVIINHPDRIIRKPRWTEQEVERARTIKVICPDADRIRCRIYENKGRVQHVCEGNRTMLTIWFDAFPSIQIDEYAKLDEIVGGAE